MGLHPVTPVTRGSQEGDAEFKSRMEIAKTCPGIVFPRGKSENSDQFKQRMVQQHKSKQSIMPKAVDETDRCFKKRIECQCVRA